LAGNASSSGRPNMAMAHNKFSTSNPEAMFGE
jgi:hypothetical protein